MKAIITINTKKESHVFSYIIVDARQGLAIMYNKLNQTVHPSWLAAPFHLGPEIESIKIDFTEIVE